MFFRLTNPQAEIFAELQRRPASGITESPLRFPLKAARPVRDLDPQQPDEVRRFRFNKHTRQRHSDMPPILEYISLIFSVPIGTPL